MTKAEKQRLTALLRATEYLFLENLALKLILEHCKIKNWETLLDHPLTDKELLAGVTLKFRYLTPNSTNPQTRQTPSMFS